MLSIASYIDFYVVKMIPCKSSCIYYLKKMFCFVFFPHSPQNSLYNERTHFSKYFSKWWGAWLLSTGQYFSSTSKGSSPDLHGENHFGIPFSCSALHPAECFPQAMCCWLVIVLHANRTLCSVTAMNKQIPNWGFSLRPESFFIGKSDHRIVINCGCSSCVWKVKSLHALLYNGQKGASTTKHQDGNGSEMLSLWHYSRALLTNKRCHGKYVHLYIQSMSQTEVHRLTICNNICIKKLKMHCGVGSQILEN